MIQLNISALVELNHAFLPTILERWQGGIINVSSIAGFQPMLYWSVYAASKAFVLSFSEALWAEVKEKGVKVLALCPGPTESNFFKVAEVPSNSEMNSNLNQLDSVENAVKLALAVLESGQPIYDHRRPSDTDDCQPTPRSAPRCVGRFSGKAIPKRLN